MKLGELKAILMIAPRHKVCAYGFGNPHSYRGIYAECAFEPADNVTVESMLDDMERALKETFEGWKGGNYKYNEGTECHIAVWGETSLTDGFPSEMLAGILVDK